MKRLITPVLPQFKDFTLIQGIAYSNMLDVIVNDDVPTPKEAVYEAVMKADRTVEVMKDATYGLHLPAHTFSGWPVPESAKEAEESRLVDMGLNEA